MKYLFHLLRTPPIPSIKISNKIIKISNKIRVKNMLTFRTHLLLIKKLTTRQKKKLTNYLLTKDPSQGKIVFNKVSKINSRTNS